MKTMLYKEKKALLLHVKDIKKTLNYYKLNSIGKRCFN